MNERIDQLLVKAGAYFGGEGIDYSNFDPKKFAELIVKECAKRVDYWESRQGEHTDDILKHFGVEE